MTRDAPHAVPFDNHAGDYASQLQQGLAVSGESQDFFARGRVAALRAWWKGEGRGEPKRVLDYGCGIGGTTRLLARAFPGARVLGVEPSTRCVERAREEFASEQIAFEDLEAFAADPGEPADLVYLNGVVHHVPPADRPAFFGGLASHVAPGGVVAVFDNNPWNPGTRLVMSRIPFDRDAVPVRPGEMRRRLRAAGLEPVATRFYFYFPRALRLLRPLEPPLERLPLGAQYAVYAAPAAGARP